MTAHIVPFAALLAGCLRPMFYALQVIVILPSVAAHTTESVAVETQSASSLAFCVLKGRRVARHLQVYVDRLSSNVQVVRRNSNSCRRVMLHGSDGSLRAFLVQSSQVNWTTHCRGPVVMTVSHIGVMTVSHIGSA